MIGVEKQNFLTRLLVIIMSCIVLMLCINTVHAAIYTNLPKSTISDTFPTSYQSYIDNLKKIYPNATFKAVNTGLDWNTVVQHESYEVHVGRSTIEDSFGAAWKRDGKNNYVDGSYVTASKDAVAYVLDPRNSLSEEYVFQFKYVRYENLGDGMNEKVIEAILQNTKMVGTYEKKYKNAGLWISMDKSYSQIIADIVEKLDVSSDFTASRIRQETSGNIESNKSIYGSYSGYEGLYNFFNIGASPNSDGTGAIANGLKRARSEGWTTPYKSIYGGVKFIKEEGYISYGQYTVYFQKFDVNNPYGNAKGLMCYQYQTNILAPRSESLISYAAYKKLNLFNADFVFYIPVYNNMPSKACPEPGTTTSTPSTTDINISDSGITGVNPGTTVSELKSKIVAEDMTVVIKNAVGTVLDDTVNVGTGCVVELQTGAGEVAESYPVTIYGDIDGDGLIDSTDLLLIRQQMSGKRKLAETNFKAANIYRTDSVIDSADLLLLRQHMSKKRSIEQ